MLGFRGADGRGTSVTFPVIEGFRGRAQGPTVGGGVVVQRGSVGAASATDGE
jgi:hypothetical protein